MNRTFSLFHRLPVACLLLLALASGRAAVVELAPGISYLRVASLSSSATELKDALQKSAALVLDLRQVTDGDGATESLQPLRAGSVQSNRLYILVSPSTPNAIAGELPLLSARVTVLGIKGSHPVPQVTVDQTEENDRRAYAAAGEGTPLADLISGRIEKERFDEASLVKEFKGGNRNATPPTPQTTNPEANKGDKAATKPVDRVLQRAVHLHRALQALKRG